MIPSGEINGKWQFLINGEPRFAAKGFFGFAYFPRFFVLTDLGIIVMEKEKILGGVEERTSLNLFLRLTNRMPDINGARITIPIIQDKIFEKIFSIFKISFVLILISLEVYAQLIRACALAQILWKIIKPL